jgi:hypothetical protein
MRRLVFILGGVLLFLLILTVLANIISVLFGYWSGTGNPAVLQVFGSPHLFGPIFGPHQLIWWLFRIRFSEPWQTGILVTITASGMTILVGGAVLYGRKKPKNTGSFGIIAVDEK